MWIGPMRRDGVKVNDIVVGIDFGGYTEKSIAERKANAAHIVKCVNNHDALVDALKNLWKSCILADQTAVGRIHLQHAEHILATLSTAGGKE